MKFSRLKDVEHELHIVRDTARESHIILLALLRYLKLEAVKEVTTGLRKIQPKEVQ